MESGALGNLGLGPKEIDYTDKYRIEEIIEGRTLTFLELTNPTVMRVFAEKICDLNYNESLKKELI